MTELTAVKFGTGIAHRPRLSKPYVPGAPRHERYWSDAEKQVLADHLAAKGVDYCLALLPKRTRLSLYQTAHKLGIKIVPRVAARRDWKAIDFDDRLIAAWPGMARKGALGAFAKTIGVPRWLVSRRATRLGLTRPREKEPPWSPAELALMKRVPLNNPHHCAQIFRDHGYRRTETAIVIKAKRLNLSRRDRSVYSATRAAAVLGIDGHAITDWIEAGHLKAARRETKRLPQQGGHPWIIAPAELRRFIVDNVELIDLRKVEKFEFVALLAGAAAPPAAPKGAA
jgi:hypothetical protein